MSGGLVDPSEAPAESHNPSMRLDHFNGTETQTENYPWVLTFSHFFDINDLLWKSLRPTVASGLRAN